MFPFPFKTATGQSSFTMILTIHFRRFLFRTNIRNLFQTLKLIASLIWVLIMVLVFGFNSYGEEKAKAPFGRTIIKMLSSAHSTFTKERVQSNFVFINKCGNPKDRETLFFDRPNMASSNFRLTTKLQKKCPYSQ